MLVQGAAKENLERPEPRTESRGFEMKPLTVKCGMREVGHDEMSNGPVSSRVVIPIDPDWLFPRQKLFGFPAQHKRSDRIFAREQHDAFEQEITEWKVAIKVRKILDSNFDQVLRGERYRKIHREAIVLLQRINKNLGAFSASGQLQGEFKHEQAGNGHVLQAAF